jgi:hypothetical protein
MSVRRFSTNCSQFNMAPPVDSITYPDLVSLEATLSNFMETIRQFNHIFQTEMKPWTKVSLRDDQQLDVSVARACQLYERYKQVGEKWASKYSQFH